MDSVAEARAELTEGHTSLGESMFIDVGGAALSRNSTATFENNSKRSFGDDAESIVKQAKKAKNYYIDFERANAEEKLKTWYHNEIANDVVNINEGARKAMSIAQDIDADSIAGLSKWSEILTLRKAYFDKVL